MGGMIAMAWAIVFRQGVRHLLLDSHSQLSRVLLMLFAGKSEIDPVTARWRGAIPAQWFRRPWGNGASEPLLPVVPQARCRHDGSSPSMAI